MRQTIMEATLEVMPSAEARIDRDQALMESLRTGESTAPERLLETYGDRAYRLALHITGSHADAEEVVQDALWAVVRKISGFRGQAAFGSWVYRIVANAACQKLRRRRWARADVPLDAVSGVVDERREAIADWSIRIDDPAVQSDLRRVLTAAIDELPVAYRTMVVLRDIEGLSNPEVSAATGMTVANVKTRVHRARLLLRKRLQSYLASEPVAA